MLIHAHSPMVWSRADTQSVSRWPFVARLVLSEQAQYQPGYVFAARAIASFANADLQFGEPPDKDVNQTPVP